MYSRGDRIQEILRKKFLMDSTVLGINEVDWELSWIQLGEF